MLCNFEHELTRSAPCCYIKGNRLFECAVFGTHLSSFYLRTPSDKMVKMNWNHDKIKRIIYLYSQQPVLWDPTDDNYHLKNQKNNAWGLIASHLQCEVEEVKNKMTSLLQSYRREKLKIKKSMGTGKGRDKIYKPKWFGFKYFEFLRNKGTPNNSVNTENYFVDIEASQQLSEDVGDEQNKLTDPLLTTTDGSASTLASAKEEGAAPKRILFFPLQNPAKKNKRKDDQRLTEAYSILENVSNVPDDECTTFGQHIVTKLRKFDEQQRSLLMHKINNLIFEAETELYSQEHIYTSSSSAASSSYSTAKFCYL